MFEAERQSYLNALGIVQYVAREPIPGALISQVLSDEQIYPPVQADEAIEQQTPVPATQPQVEAVSAPAVAPQTQQEVSDQNVPAPAARTQEPVSTQGLTVNIPQELLGGADQAQPSAKKRNPVQQTGNPEFCLVFVETMGGLSLLVELGDPGVKDMSAQEHRLMADILKALAIDTEQCRYHYFKWPLVNNPKIKQGFAEAAETFTGFIEGKVSQRHQVSIVVFGETPANVLNIQSQQCVLMGNQVVAVQVPPFAAMLQDWRAKAQAWRMLAPLRGRAI